MVVEPWRLEALQRSVMAAWDLVEKIETSLPPWPELDREGELIARAKEALELCEQELQVRMDEYPEEVGE